MQSGSSAGARWWTLGAISAATFMLLLDISAVVTALPSIERDLGAGFVDLQWVVDAYTITLAAFVLTAGSLADRLGRRRVFAVGLGLFSVASLLVGLSPNPTFLNVARGMQGVGGAILFAVSLALLAHEFAPGAERARAMAAYGATLGIAVAVGPLVGGALTEALGWEWIFFINVPVGAATLAVTFTRLRESRDPDAGRTDWAGLATLSGGLFLLVLGLLRGNADGWGSPPVVAVLAGSAALLAAFIAVERRVPDPMLPLELFRRPAFTGVQVAAFAVAGSVFGLYIHLTLYLQNFLGYSPLETGLRFLPNTLAMFVVPMLAAALLTRVPARILIAAGLGLSGIGVLLMSGLDAGSGWEALVAGFLVAGAGAGLLNPVLADLSVSVVPANRSGMAAGINDTFRQVGLAVGIAVWGALFLGRGADRVAELAAGTPAAAGETPRRLVEAASSGRLEEVPGGAGGRLAAAAREGVLAGLNDVLALAGVVALIGAVLAFVLVRDRAAERRPLEAAEGASLG